MLNIALKNGCTPPGFPPSLCMSVSLSLSLPSCFSLCLAIFEVQLFRLPYWQFLLSSCVRLSLRNDDCAFTLQASVACSGSS